MKISIASIFLFCPLFLFAQLRINEVSSANGSIEDEFGKNPDWIEIKNSGDQPISLANYYLSDQEEDLFKWNFPNQVLNPGEFLLLFSEDEESSPIHFNFGISSEGETLFLSKAPFGLESSLNVPSLYAEHSFGYNETNADYFYFEDTTPNAENSNNIKTGYSQDFELPVNGGYYSEPVLVELDGLCETGTVHITYDGKFPTENDESPESFWVESTTVIKGVCIEPGKLASNTSTSTLLFNETESMPIISLSVDSDSLFHDSLGIYMPGPNAEEEWPYFGANYWSNNQIKTSFEYFENGELKVDQDIDLTIHGGKSSRTKLQRPLRLTARNRYGSEFINHAFFEEKPEVDTFKHLVLRNSGADFLKSNIRDGFWHQLVLKENLDFEVFGYQPAVVLINGEYWGVMHIRERVSEYYLAENHGISPDEILITEKELEPFLGDSIYFQDFAEFVINNDLNIEENYTQVADELDIESYMDYFSTEIFSGNLDWPSNNIKYWKESPTSGKWRYIMYDLDTTVELFQYIPMDADLFYHIFVDKEWAVNSKVFINLLENNEFKRLFINRLADLMNTSFSEENLTELLDEIEGEFVVQKTPHFQRWFGNQDTYDLHIQELFPEFFSVRKGFVQEHVINHFELENTVNLTFDVYPEDAGTIQLNTLNPELPFSGDYFNGNPIDVTAIPAEGQTFLRWDYSEELIENGSENSTIQYNFNTSGTLTAVFEDSVSKEFSVLNSPINVSYVEAVFNSGDEGTYDLTVYSIDGRVIYNSSEIIGEGKNVINLNLPVISQGVYLISIENGEERFTSKFSRL